MTCTRNISTYPCAGLHRLRLAPWTGPGRIDPSTTNQRRPATPKFVSSPCRSIPTARVTSSDKSTAASRPSNPGPRKGYRVLFYKHVPRCTYLLANRRLKFRVDDHLASPIAGSGTSKTATCAEGRPGSGPQGPAVGLDGAVPQNASTMAPTLSSRQAEELCVSWTAHRKLFRHRS